MVAWDVDGLSKIPVEFPMTSRGDWLVFEMCKADDWKSIAPGSTPAKGKLDGC